MPVLPGGKESPTWGYINVIGDYLVGGADPLSFRLRVAQSHIRSDLTPSSWSHVLILAKLSMPLAKSPTCEVSLSPHDGFGGCGCSGCGQ